MILNDTHTVVAAYARAVLLVHLGACTGLHLTDTTGGCALKAKGETFSEQGPGNEVLQFRR
jgi:hypothetical protein